MVNPIHKQIPNYRSPSLKKKAEKEIDQRVKRAAKKSDMKIQTANPPSLKSSSKLSDKSARLAAEKASQIARGRAIETQKAAQRAAKKAALARRMHTAQQIAAVKRGRAEEKSRKEGTKKGKKEKRDF